MKTTLRLWCLLFALFCFASPSKAQTPAEASEYMQKLATHHENISEGVWEYVSAIARGKKPLKVEAKRQELLAIIEKADREVSAYNDFHGEVGLRDSLLAYLRVTHHVLNVEYARIAQLEPHAQESFELMENFLHAKDGASARIRSAGEAMVKEHRRFARLNDIKLVEDDSRLAYKMATASLVFGYHTDVYLVFFKPFKEESYMISALNEDRHEDLEKHRKNLITTSAAAQEMIKDMKPYETDFTLKATCLEILRFYEKEAKEKIPVIQAVGEKEKAFKQIEKEVNAIKEEDLTQADVDRFNQAAVDYNESVEAFNSTNQTINKQREILMNKWDQTVSAFLDKHVPH